MSHRVKGNVRGVDVVIRPMMVTMLAIVVMPIVMVLMLAMLLMRIGLIMMVMMGEKRRL